MTYYSCKNMALILIIDESLERLIVLKEFLLETGHNCRLANTSHMAQEILGHEYFDILLCHAENSHQFKGDRRLKIFQSGLDLNKLKEELNQLS